MLLWFVTITHAIVTTGRAIQVVVSIPRSPLRKPCTSFDSTHVNALLDLECLDVNTPNRVCVVKDNERLSLEVELKVAAGSKVVSSDRKDFLDHLSFQIVIY